MQRSPHWKPPARLLVVQRMPSAELERRSPGPGRLRSVLFASWHSPAVLRPITGAIDFAVPASVGSAPQFAFAGPARYHAGPVRLPEWPHGWREPSAWSAN